MPVASIQPLPIDPKAFVAAVGERRSVGFDQRARAVGDVSRRAYGLRDEEYLRLKVLTCMLPRH
jgi:hypothetical protein